MQCAPGQAEGKDRPAIALADQGGDARGDALAGLQGQRYSRDVDRTGTCSCWE